MTLTKRLAALEAIEEERRELMREKNWAILQRARAMLSSADCLALDDVGILAEGESEEENRARALLFRRMEALGKAHNVPEEVPIAHPAKAEALAWSWSAFEDDYSPLMPPPAGWAADIAGFFEACALWSDGQASREDWPEALRRLARWGAALYRWKANLCKMLGEL